MMLGLTVREHNRPTPCSIYINPPPATCGFRSFRTFRKHEEWVEGVIVVTPAKERPDDEDEEAPPDEIFSCGADGKVRDGLLFLSEI